MSRSCKTVHDLAKQECRGSNAEVLKRQRHVALHCSAFETLRSGASGRAALLMCRQRPSRGAGWHRASSALDRTTFTKSLHRSSVRFVEQSIPRRLRTWLRPRRSAPDPAATRPDHGTHMEHMIRRAEAQPGRDHRHARGARTRFRLYSSHQRDRAAAAGAGHAHC
jgi:hypothetical protein